MKKFLTLFFSMLVLIALLTACGDSGKEKPTDDDTSDVGPGTDVDASKGSQGLRYDINEKEGVATLTGMGTCEDSRIIVPAKTADGYDVIALGDDVFRDVTYITSIQLPSTIEEIGERAFSGCTSLKSINLQDLDYLLTIPSEAFMSCVSLEEIEFPSGVGAILDRAFARCSSLQSVELPSGLSSIGMQAFMYCGRLSEITLPTDNYALIDLANANMAFGYCTSLKEFTFTDMVSVIPENLFVGCTGLRKVTLSESIESIGRAAFAGCTRLQTVNLPLASGMDEIAAMTFANCSALQGITIPSTVTTIGQGAFSGCASFTNIVLPNSVTTMHDSAFENCTSLREVQLSASLKSIPDMAFLGCENLLAIDIPNSVSSIGVMAFFNCFKLESAIFNDSVTTVKESAFANCINLTYLKTGKVLSSIGKNAFKSCTSLPFIVFETSCTIGHNAFSSCTSLKFILADPVENSEKYAIGENAFDRCTSLEFFLYNSQNEAALANLIGDLEAYNDNLALTWCIIGNENTTSGALTDENGFLYKTLNVNGTEYRYRFFKRDENFNIIFATETTVGEHISPDLYKPSADSDSGNN